MAAPETRADGAKLVPRWEFSDRLRKARSIAQQDQKEFAANLGVTAGSLAGWEAGRSKPRDVVAVAKRIEVLLGIPASWTLGLHEETPHSGGPGGGSEVRPKGFEPLTFWSVLDDSPTSDNVVSITGHDRRLPDVAAAS